MVRLDRGMRWQQPSGFPQPGTIGKLIRDRASLPGPGAFVPITTGIKGGFMSKGPMRPPTPLEILSKPGPGQYVTTEPINVHLAGIHPKEAGGPECFPCHIEVATFGGSHYQNRSQPIILSCVHL